MNSKSFQSVFSGAMIVFVGLVIDKGFSFGSTVLAARYLTLPEFGLVSLGRTLMLFVALISVLGLDKGVSRYLPREEDISSKQIILSSTTQMAMLVGLLSTLFIYLSLKYITVLFSLENSGRILKIFIVSIPILVGFRIVLGGIRGTERALPRVYSQHIARPVSNILAIITATTFGLKISGVAWSYPFSYAIGGIVALYFLNNQVPIRLRRIYSRNTYMKLISFSAPLVVSGLMYRILSDIDVFLLGYMTNSLDSIGIYKIVYPLSSLLLLVLTAFGYMALPIFSNLDSQGNNNNNDNNGEINKMYGFIRKWTFIFSLPISILMLFFSKTLIVWTFGSKYLPGTVAFQILVIGFSIHTMVGPNGNALQAIGDSKSLMYCNLIAAIVNTVLNFFLIPKMGIEGAAIATTLSYGLMNFLYMYILYIKVKIHPISRVELNILLISVPSIVLITSELKQIFHSTILYLLASFVLFLILYLGIVISLGIGKAELDILSNVKESHSIPGISVLIKWAS